MLLEYKGDTMNIFDISTSVQNSLSEDLIKSNQMLETVQETMQDAIKKSNSTAFNEEQMDALMNKIGLTIQRKGGK